MVTITRPATMTDDESLPKSGGNRPSHPKLSICIATFNRGAFIGETLKSILDQSCEDCEVIVLDGGSTDCTQRVVSEFAERYSILRYVRQQINSGIDQDYDRAVEMACGDYCWLMTDDDLIKPGGVHAVVDALAADLSVIIANTEYRSCDLSKLVQRRAFDFDSNRLYHSDEMERLVLEVGDPLRYIGSFIIKRSIWLSRERAPYYGSWFVYLGVIFQERLPGDMLVMAEPIISYRMGNTHTWSPRATEILFVKWPSLISLLALSESAKRRLRSAEPWRSARWLLVLRGLGLYSSLEYRSWVRPRLRTLGERIAPAAVAFLPGGIVNKVLIVYYSITGRKEGRLQALKESSNRWSMRGLWEGES